MAVEKKNEHVLYRGARVPVAHFRAWVYGAEGAAKLANSWDEYKLLVATGQWFDEPPQATANDKKRSKSEKG